MNRTFGKKSQNIFQFKNCPIDTGGSAYLVELFTPSTGCNSGKWKKVQANILKEPLVLLKQKIPQQKALDLSFNLTP